MAPFRFEVTPYKPVVAAPKGEQLSDLLGVSTITISIFVNVSLLGFVTNYNRIPF